MMSLRRVRPRREQDRNDIENCDRALERRQHVDQENRESEDGETRTASRRGSSMNPWPDQDWSSSLVVALLIFGHVDAAI